MLFELNPETIEISSSVQSQGKPVRISHILRSPKEADWLEYDKGLAVAIEGGDVAGSIKQTDDSYAAACELWDAISLDVTGYAEANPPNFRELVPPAHKRRMIRELTRVYPSAEPFTRSGLFLVSDEEVIRIAAKRGEEYPILIHRFKAPTPKQHIEYSRIVSDSYEIKGPKNGKGKVILPSRLGQVVRLYNELIISTEGYSLNGEPLTDARIAQGPGGKDIPPAKIIAFMDSQHKRVAVQLLFASDEVEIEEQKESDDDAAAD